jgi:hypothetical protein
MNKSAFAAGAYLGMGCLEYEESPNVPEEKEQSTMSMIRLQDILKKISKIHSRYTYYPRFTPLIT